MFLVIATVHQFQWRKINLMTLIMLTSLFLNKQQLFCCGVATGISMVSFVIDLQEKASTVSGMVIHCT